MSADLLTAHLLLSVAAIIAAAGLLRVLLGKIGQPKALAEILAGLALGPSLLGRLPGDPSRALFPTQVRPALSLIGAVGLVLFAFALGSQIDLPSLRRRGPVLAGVSIGALAVPFSAGTALAIALYRSNQHVGGHSVPELAFILFVATAMSITAFPVLASILSERGLRRTPLGELALGSAAAQDAVGWMLLAVALSAASVKHGGNTLWTLALMGAFLVVLVVVIRPALRALLARRSQEHDTATVLALAIATAVAAGGFTQLIGVHEVLGAFAAGIAFPRSRQTTGTLATALMPLTLAALLPVYFLTPGLAINLGAIPFSGVGQFLLITLLACATKLIGSVVPARALGMAWDEAGPLGVLLNTRGLMELVVLTVGYTDGILDSHLFTELVLMAIATTMLTCPLLSALERRGLHAPRNVADSQLDVLPLAAPSS